MHIHIGKVAFSVFTIMYSL